MTLYLPGPWEIELLYVENGLTHIQRLNCDVLDSGDVGDPMSDFLLKTRNGLTIAANSAVNNWIALIRNIFAVSTNFTVANLYKYVPDSTEKTFYSTMPVGVIGVAAGVGTSMQQLILTFRSQLGNSVKVNFLETATTGSLRQPMDDAPANQQAIADWLTSTNSWVLARDGSYPIGQLNACNGRNDAIERKRFR